MKDERGDSDRLLRVLTYAGSILLFAAIAAPLYFIWHSTSAWKGRFYLLTLSLFVLLISWGLLTVLTALQLVQRRFSIRVSLVLLLPPILFFFFYRAVQWSRFHISFLRETNFYAMILGIVFLGIILLSFAAIASMPRHPMRRLLGAVHLVLLALITGGIILWVSMLFRDGNDWQFSSGVGTETIRYLSGRTLPSFEAPMLDGSTVSSNMLHGKVAFLDFWATWCDPCVKSLPHLQKMHKDFSGDRFVAIGMNTGEQRARVERFMIDNAYTFPVAFANQGIQNIFHVSGIPSIFIADRHGMIRYVQVGYYPERVDSIRTMIQTLLQEP